MCSFSFYIIANVKFRQRATIIPSRKIDVEDIPSKAAASKSRLYLNIIHIAFAIVRLKISGAVIAHVHSVVVALAHYVTKFVDSVQS